MGKLNHIHYRFPFNLKVKKNRIIFVQTVNVFDLRHLKDLKHLELNDLLDLLVEHTYNHSKLIANGATLEQFKLSDENLQQIQQEIELRRLERQTNQDVA